MELERSHRRWELETKERQQFLQEANDKLHFITDRQRAIEKTIENTRESLKSAQTLLEQLQKQCSVLGRLGAQIRKISTFLASLHGKMGDVHSRHQLMVLFSPLLKSVDSLVTFLEDNANIVVSIADQEALSKIRRNVMLGWEN